MAHLNSCNIYPQWHNWIMFCFFKCRRKTKVHSIWLFGTLQNIRTVGQQTFYWEYFKMLKFYVFQFVVRVYICIVEISFYINYLKVHLRMWVQFYQELCKSTIEILRWKLTCKGSTSQCQQHEHLVSSLNKKYWPINEYNIK